MKYSKIVLLFFVFIMSCKSKNCPYFEGISQYFKNEHKKDLNYSQEELYYVLDLQGCEPCTDLNTKMLLGLKHPNEKLTIVFVGQTSNNELNRRVNVLKTKFNYLIDSELKIFEYQTNLAKPLLIHLKNRSCYNIMIVNDPIIKEAQKYINSN